MHFVFLVMTNHRPPRSGPIDARDTLEVSVDELERPSNPVDVVSAAGPTVRGASIAAVLLVVGSVVLASVLVVQTIKKPESRGPSAKAAVTTLRLADVVTPKLGSDAPELTCSDVNALVPEQYIELDAVKLKGRRGNPAR